MAGISEISRLQGEIASLNARKVKCGKAISQLTLMCANIEMARKKLTETREYMSVEYMGKRTGKITDKMDIIDNNAVIIKDSYAPDFISDLKKLQNSLESQIRKKRDAIEALRAEMDSE